MLFICYPKCTTCQKAKQCLNDNNIAYTERNIKENNPSYEELKAFYKKSGLPLKRFFNTSGLIYKEMKLKDKLPIMSEDEQLKLLATDGMLVKRPILVDDDFVLVGFKQLEWREKLQEKKAFSVDINRKVLAKSYLGKMVNIQIDRPIGYIHRKNNYSITYPVNYGYIPGVFSGDGEELDVYLLGVNEPVKKYSAKIIGIVHRHNDVEDKLIAAPLNTKLSKEEIIKSVHFQEQYFDIEIELL